MRSCHNLSFIIPGKTSLEGCYWFKLETDTRCSLEILDQYDKSIKTKSQKIVGLILMFVEVIGVKTVKWDLPFILNMVDIWSEYNI